MTETMFMIIYYSMLFNFDPAISLAVVRQETNFNNQIVGDIGEVGLFQIRPEFVKDYTRKQLQRDEVNIIVGIKKLKEAKTRCKHRKDLDWLTCYNAGITGGNRIKYPKKFKYVVNVTKYYKEYKNERTYAREVYKNR